MKLTYALLADNVITSNTNNLSIIDIFDLLATPEFPVTKPKCVVTLGFIVEPEDLNRNVTLLVQLLNPDAKPIRAVELDIGIDKAYNLLTKLRVNVPFEFLEFQVPGAHEFDIRVDGVTAETIPLIVTAL
jgi:hypothetical protein